MLKWLDFGSSETLNSGETEGHKLLEFHSNEVNITETGGGNQTQKLSERQGSMPQMHSC